MQRIPPCQRKRKRGREGEAKKQSNKESRIPVISSLVLFVCSCLFDAVVGLCCVSPLVLSSCESYQAIHPYSPIFTAVPFRWTDTTCHAVFDYVIEAIMRRFMFFFFFRLFFTIPCVFLSFLFKLYVFPPAIFLKEGP